jgi:hypothetical protein
VVLVCAGVNTTTQNSIVAMLTELIHLTRHPKRFNLATTIVLDGTTVKPSIHVRILGIEIDSKLRWSPHIRKVQSKLE